VVSFIENEFEVILQELERNSNIYSNDIVTTIADELQEYNSRSQVKSMDAVNLFTIECRC
jgi:hypothetical protein